MDRASALMRLAADGRTDLVDTAIAWLAHPESMLRSEAITVLLTFWRRESALPAVLELLHQDPDPEVRGAAAIALSRFIEHAPSYRARVLDALFHQLTHDEDPIMQRTCYKKLLHHILPKEAVPDLPYRFHRDTDVDWELLRPWRDALD